MKIDVKNKTVTIEIPFEEITHVYSTPIGETIDNEESEVGFGIEVHHTPYIDLKLLIEDGKFATEIMQTLSEIKSNVRLG